MRIAENNQAIISLELDFLSDLSMKLKTPAFKDWSSLPTLLDQTFLYAVERDNTTPQGI